MNRTSYAGASGGTTALHKWIRMQYTGTAFNFLLSNDGQHWVQIATVSSTAYLSVAPTNCGIAINCDALNYSMNVLSWAATTP
ncbi:hypothetical protein [Burkholderia sp. LMG 32019]|uniref:hypothetical protein n=1 Tax=Burkholderia sp. LMG 32019 TaxID=3158173 RepID=UPI003C2DFB78